VGTTTTVDIDMARYANFPLSRYVLDGGLIDNDPLDDVLEAISSQPAVGPVHRTILFVNPLGALVESPKAVLESDAPSIFKVLEDTALIPRQHSNVNLYNKLRLRQGQADKLRRFRSGLFGSLFGIGDVDGGTEVGGISWDLPTVSATGLVATAEQIAPEVMAHRSRLRARQGETSTPAFQEARQSLLIVQDLLGRAVALYGTEGFEQVRESVASALRAQGPEPPADVGATVTQSMTTLIGRVPGLNSARGTAETQLSLEVHGLQTLGAAATPPDSTLVDWLLALKVLGILQSAVTDGDVHNPQHIGFVEVSAVNSATSNLAADKKLTGVQIAHFGAFYAESWRRNDWIWGRLDGSYRLIALLVDPEFLLERGEPSEVGARLASLQGGTDDFATQISEGLSELAAMPLGLARQTAAEQLQVIIASKLWIRRRTEILQLELPGLVNSVHSDELAGVKFPENTDSYIKAAADLTPASTPEEVVDAWTLSTVAGWRLTQQFETRKFADTGSRAAAVGASALDRSIPWAPVRWAFKPLVWALRDVNRFATMSFRRRPVRRR
jgi:hypothetical protein